nr:transforming growth factor-beta receptor-associated protein 1 [Quercus suber]
MNQEEDAVILSNGASSIRGVRRMQCLPNTVHESPSRVDATTSVLTTRISGQLKPTTDAISLPSAVRSCPDHEGMSAKGMSATFTFRPLIDSVPVATDDDPDAHITCVDAWNGNLYIGTSAGEVLHYVSIPSDPSDPTGQPTYIFATKLQPDFTTLQEGADAGVKQILLLPDAGKACILCNGTLTFYTLPELSPAFEPRIKQAGCLWVGGMDLRELASSSAYGPVIVICLKQRLRLIRIGEAARKIRDIEMAGVSKLQRRKDLACVADDQTYSLLDVVNQRKSELFPISSLNAAQRDRQEQLQPSRAREASRSVSSASPVRPSRGHERNVSLGGVANDENRLRPDSASPFPARRSSREAPVPDASSSRETSLTRSGSGDTSTRTSTDQPRMPIEEPPVTSLPAHILSPTKDEFLLTTGTTLNEPGVGMFVNLEGDVVRGTLEFTSYPEALILSGCERVSEDVQEQPNDRGYVLALVRRRTEKGVQRAIEIQRWDAEPGEVQFSKEWIDVGEVEDAGLNNDENESQRLIGLRTATSATELAVPEISASLRLRRVAMSTDLLPATEADMKRDVEEDRFASRFSKLQTNLLFYNHDQVHWIAQNSSLVRLEKQLDDTVLGTQDGAMVTNVLDVQKVVNSIRGQEASDEFEFLTLTYIRQKASLLLFGHMLTQTAAGIAVEERDRAVVEDALVAGDIDPRILLILVPSFNKEVQEGEHGIWIFQGLVDLIAIIRSQLDSTSLPQDANGTYSHDLLKLMKMYLLIWRKKKGFGSVTDEVHVFRTVDAVLLHILLLLDEKSPRGPATANTVRAEMNEIVDRGVDCFDRVAALFEQFHRLYMLSRLYQSRKMTAQVLATWKRIIEGERDDGGELIDGEQDVRRYLAKLRDASLVQEYGSWLAARNPRLGVQAFADDAARVKFRPSEAVAILRQKAPEAVKDYLEHLVFGKGHTQYVNELIAFYLDSVLQNVSSEEASRNTLRESYATYRALAPPKPTYRDFITDNAIAEEWWQNRLRLLQLIGGAASAYDVSALRARLAPFSDELVPEMIILNGHEGKHEEALRLLVSGLGDYDTAIRYCLLGGSSTFAPSTMNVLSTDRPAPSRTEQERLLSCLLRQFLELPSLSERLERTSDLLARFSTFFDIADVLSLIPNSWSVELVEGFLTHALRRLVEERNETELVKGLSAAQNLRQSGQVIEKLEGLGPMIVHDEVQT